jgi:hypothetical protein
MNSNIEIIEENFAIVVTETGPQTINPKKSRFLFGNNLNQELLKSPRRDSMPFTFSKSSKSLIIQNPIIIKKEEKIKDPIKERIELKIIENIKNRQGFESLLQDPEISIFINK